MPSSIINLSFFFLISFFLSVFPSFFPSFRIMHSTQLLLAGPLFFLFIIFAGVIALSLLSLENVLHDLSFEILLGIDLLLTQNFLSLLICSYATEATTQTALNGYQIYDAKWYYLPCEQQMMIVPLVQQAQVTYQLYGFKMITCSMNTYSTV